jgi:hypothetical protein
MRQVMSDETNAHTRLTAPDRREVLRAAGTAIGGVTVTALAMSPSASAQGSTNSSRTPATEDRNSAALGARLRGVQHFGLTVQNMDRAFEFYTDVLGGTEIMRDGDFRGERIHNTLLTDQEIVARE